MVQADGVVGSGILYVPTLGDGALILCATLGGERVSTLGGAVSPALCSRDVCYTLVVSPGLFRRS